MKIACVVFGTRGDVQPVVALAAGLIRKGHDILICAPPENEKLVQRSGCTFIAFGPSVKKAIGEHPERQKSGVTIQISPREGKLIVDEQINRLPELIAGVDAVLGVGIVPGVHTAADILNVPYRLLAYYPILLGAGRRDPWVNRTLFGFGRFMVNVVLRRFINQNRGLYDLPPIDDVWAHWMGEQVIVACDRDLNPVPEEVSFSFTQTGFMLLATETGLPDRVEQFLEGGNPPVYIGFGSNPIADVRKFQGLFEQVRDRTGQRLIVSRGWAGLPDTGADDILFVDEVPFDQLFPRLAAVVSHGGTGTVATTARSGVPQAAFPFMADQFANRKRIVKLELGPPTSDFKKMTAASLAGAINALVSNDVFKRNAVEIAAKLGAVDGVALTARLLEDELNRVSTRHHLEAVAPPND